MTYNAPIRPAGMPPQADMLTFSSGEERARAAHPQFEKVADSYSHTDSGTVARYLAAITAREMGDNSLAEKEFKQAAGQDIGLLWARRLRAHLFCASHDGHKRSPSCDYLRRIGEHLTFVTKSSDEFSLIVTVAHLSY